MSLTITEIVKFHSDIEENWQFKSYEMGVRSWSALDRIVEKPSTKVYGFEPYPDIYSKCACLIEEIIKSHPFYNGNKRTALAVAHHYMHKNGYNMIIPFQAVKYSVIIAASSRINVQCIAKWVNQHSCPIVNLEEYYSKLEEYFTKPAKMILNLYESRQYHKVNSILSDWFRYDVNPDYRTDMVKTVRFLLGMIKSPPPPAPPQA